MSTCKDNGRLNLIFDTPHDALKYSIVSSGKSLKEMAIKVYPGVEPETAVSKLSRALNPDNHDVGLKIEIIQAIMDETSPEYFMSYFTKRNGYKDEKQSPLTPEEELKMLKNIIMSKGLQSVFKDVM